MSKTYIIVDGENRRAKYVARRHIGDFKAIDYWDSVYPQHDGRITCSTALTFDTFERARQYAKHDAITQGKSWKVKEYDSCACTIVGCCDKW